MVRRLALLGLLGALAAVACGGSDASGQGALGAGAISPPCAPDDENCQVAGFQAPLAVGAEMPAVVRINLEGSATPSLSITSVNPAVLEVVDGARLRGVSPGVSALLVMGPGGRVIDFVHLWVQQATSLSLRRGSEQGVEPQPLPPSFQLLVDDDFHVIAEAFNGPQALIGQPDATWELSPEGVVQMLDVGIPGRRRLVARAPGTATLTVSSLSLKSTLTMEVLP